MRCMERLFRRAGVALAMSEGFHPKPRMTFPLALAVGIEGSDEVMEVELAEPHSPAELLELLTPLSPPGLTLKTAELLPPGSKKAKVRSVCYQVPVPAECCRGLDQRISRLMASPSYPLQRPNRTMPIDLRADLTELTLQHGVLSMRLRTGSQGGARPREVLEALGLAELELQGVHLSRSAVEIQ
jgi:radical SAM-linked protein